MPERLRAACNRAHFSGMDAIQASVHHQSTLVYSEAFGAASTESIFDVASVTKLAATTLIACVLHSRKALSLDDSISKYLPELHRSHSGITVHHLLAHSSGLPAWQPFFRDCLDIPGAFPGPPTAAGMKQSRHRCLQAVKSALPLSKPGHRRVYSDTGFILLGEVLQVIGGSSLELLAQELVFDPAQLQNTRFHRLGTPFNTQGIVPTGSTRPRAPAPGQEGLFPGLDQNPRRDPGEVDDDNAYALGGVAGHAGLFSTAADLSRLGALLLEELSGAERFGVGESLRLFSQPDLGPEGPARGLGFDRIAPVGSSVGPRWGQGPGGGFGHLGFTGCALWVDVTRGLSASLLTNRVLHGREHTEGIKSLRPEFFDGVIETYPG